MIYVSSSCVKGETIRESVEQLVQAGYRNIELSGGTKLYPELEQDLLELKEKHGLHFLCHNYFPPPPVDFVLNLASLDEEVSRLSREHLIRSLKLSQSLGASRFAFHAGFLINIPVNQIGKVIAKQELFDRGEAIQRFNENYAAVAAQADAVKLYVENNVISGPNFESYEGINPLFLTDTSGLQEFDVLPLLDVAHLKVSCQTLGLPFQDELRTFAELTDYIHVSDNNGEVDSNQELRAGSQLFEHLRAINWADKVVTLEVYSGLDNLRLSYDNMLNIIREVK